MYAGDLIVVSASLGDLQVMVDMCIDGLGKLDNVAWPRPLNVVHNSPYNNLN